MEIRREAATYSRAEIISDAVVHGAAILAALIAVPVLVTLAALWVGDATTITALVIYGVTLIAMFCCSAFYNFVTSPAWHDYLRRVDQSAIYIKIAGAYTPFVVLTGTSAGVFLAGVWAVALAGVTMVLFGPPRPRWPALALYLGLGWAGLVLGRQMITALTPAGRDLVILAGALYSTGLVFFLWERLRFHNTIWHVFVLAGSGLVYAAVVLELWSRAATAI
ncbi:PAQR family membrane homeostasis protein TrhA [Amaricoccus solimangrovi]|uniref:Hly-III family protein n=1 Tax=Amaricoccus solimangrovi TaxID=2589815 RepID=A0A501WJB7_9RHOB|nr:hemolysin III family protein [Amaricoccus solimangrovi]TPE49448.1 Hly-III family protein [Amaricoccus solimangrovi]